MVARLTAVPGLKPGGRVGVDALSPAFAELLPFELVDAAATLHEARRVKTGDEVACLATAAALAQAGLLAVVDALAAGVTERRLLGVLAERVAQLGVPILASEAVACATALEGPVTYRHLAGDRPIERGQLVALTPGVLYAGYEGGVGRTYAAGASGGESPQGFGGELARRGRDALDALIDACQPGATGAEVERAWVATGEPLPPPSLPLVHGAGLGTEPPLIGNGYGRHAELCAGLVLAVQSWVTAEGTGGHLERDLVVVGDDGPRRLTRLGPGAGRAGR
jgi:Xaa-Pro aminopeptidase